MSENFTVWISPHFRVSYETYLASSKRYIVAFIDGRGTSNRGWRNMAPLYRALGGIEITDQNYATR